MAVAVVTLLLGLVVGFFIGRATEADSATNAAPALTSPSTSSTRPPGNTIPPNPPVDPGAPPSTDLDPSSIGTVEDPIPVGQSYILGLYEVEVRSAVRDATEMLAQVNPSNPPPPEGRRHLIVEIAVRFTEDNGLGNPAAIPFFVSDGVARWNDFESSCGIVPGSLLEAGLLGRTDEVVGNTCFTVPDDVVDDLLFGTEGFAGPLYFAIPD